MHVDRAEGPDGHTLQSTVAPGINGLVRVQVLVLQHVHKEKKGVEQE